MKLLLIAGVFVNIFQITHMEPTKDAGCRIYTAYKASATNMDRSTVETTDSCDKIAKAIEPYEQPLRK